MTSKEQVVLRPDRYNKLIETFERLELSEAKSRMALENANQRIEQLEEILDAIGSFAGDYAPFNSAMAKVQKMAQEGLE